MLETIKQHKMLFAGAAIVAVLVLVYANSGSSSAGVPQSGGNDTTAAENFQIAQLQANTQIAALGTQAQAQAESDASTLELYKLKFQTDTNANELAANIAAMQITATQQSSALHDTLSAQVAGQTLNAQTQQLSIATGAQTDQMRVMTDAMVRQTQAIVAGQASRKCTNILGVYSKCSG